MKTTLRNALKLVGWYVVAGTAWIIISDLVVAWLIGGPTPVHLMQTTKGWVFVLASGGVFFGITWIAAIRWRRMQEELLHERERYRLMIEAISDHAIFMLDPEGNVATWNTGAERITGRTTGEMVGRNVSVLCGHDPAAPTDTRRALEIAREQGSFSSECSLLRRDGSRFPAAIQIAPLRDGEGKLTGFVTVTRDISARKQAESALAAQANQYRLIFAAHPLPMLVYDLATLGILAVNDAAVSHYGYTREEFLGMTVRDIRPPEDLPRFLKAIDEVRGGRNVTPIARAGIWRHRRKDGSIIHVEVTSHVILFENRKAELVLAHDVTARLRAERELEENRARLAGIVESAMDAIITVDARQHIVVFNHAAETMFGHRATDVLGQPFARLLPERLRRHQIDTDAADSWFGATSRRLGAPDGFAGLRASGEEFPAEASIAPTPTTNGPHFTVIMRDVTERQRADEALCESRRLLQIAVDTARLGFWHFDIATSSMTVSTEWKRQLGLENETLSTDPDVLIRLAHVDDIPIIQRARRDLESGALPSVDLEFRARHKDGGYRDIRACAVLQYDAAGRPERIFGTNLDITHVRDAERTVRRLSAHVLRLQDFERRRIARELHDTTAQNLAALNMNLAQLDRALAATDPSHALLIEDTIALADLAVQEIRTLSYVLHPPLLDALGLCRTVQDYVEGFGPRSGIPTEVEVDEAIGRLSEETEIALFRVLQESLSNVHRHSGAQQAWVRLAIIDDTVELTITDDGHGMDASTRDRLRRRATVGVGIAGMTERLEQLGGTLRIESTDEGTMVCAAVPRNLGAEPPATGKHIHETL